MSKTNHILKVAKIELTSFQTKKIEFERIERMLYETGQSNTFEHDDAINAIDGINKIIGEINESIEVLTKHL